MSETNPPRHDYADAAIAAALQAKDEEIARLRDDLNSRLASAASNAIEEHEAALCPEDFGCAEYIASLKRQIEAAHATGKAEGLREGAAALERLQMRLGVCIDAANVFTGGVGAVGTQALQRILEESRATPTQGQEEP